MLLWRSCVHAYVPRAARAINLSFGSTCPPCFRSETPAAPREIKPIAFALIAAYANRLRSPLRAPPPSRLSSRLRKMIVRSLSLSLFVSTSIKFELKSRIYIRNLFMIVRFRVLLEHDTRRQIHVYRDSGSGWSTAYTRGDAHRLTEARLGSVRLGARYIGAWPIAANRVSRRCRLLFSLLLVAHAPPTQALSAPQLAKQTVSSPAYRCLLFNHSTPHPPLSLSLSLFLFSPRFAHLLLPQLRINRFRSVFTSRLLRAPSPLLSLIFNARSG